MRKFSSYGPVDTNLHYYAPRSELVERVYRQLVGDNPDESGHYITVWGPRQTGKTWLMQQALFRLQQDERFDVLPLVLQTIPQERDIGGVLRYISADLARVLNKPVEGTDRLEAFEALFSREALDKPLILILDEFDTLSEEVIAGLVKSFRNIYIRRQNQPAKSSGDKDYLLHSLALIGVRAVLGIENVTGSPFNVQRSLHIPNLTFAEVKGMFDWYQQESGQVIEPDVVERLFYETQGQPGLTCWFGELLTETYNENKPTITMPDFEITYAAALDVLPNNTVLNIISKARQNPYKQLVLEMFKTDEKIPFRYDDSLTNFLYLNGVVDWELVDKTRRYLKFSSPFVQRRLFNYFANELFRVMGKLYEPFDDLSNVITAESLTIKNLLLRYQKYLQQNRGWLLENAPRRSDLRIYEAVYHFNLYKYLAEFLTSYGGEVYPEFPTGNGQIDLLITYEGQRYGIEVKSYLNLRQYKEALQQAARYGQRLGLAEITLAFFIEAIDDDNRNKYEAVYVDQVGGVTVKPVFVEIGSRA